jgi:hypothetical protein
VRLLDAATWDAFAEEELPGIKHTRAYDKDVPSRPDWRITCLYVDDRKHRGRASCGWRWKAPQTGSPKPEAAWKPSRRA